MQHAAERVDVGARVDPAATDLLGRHVVERADPLAGARRPGARERLLGESEVRDVDVIVLGQQQVRGLDVAVDEAAEMDRVERGTGLVGDPRRPLRLQGTDDAHQRPHVGALDVAHRQVRDPVVLADVVDGDDVGVLDGCGGARFGQEPLAHASLLEQFGCDHLQRDDPVEVELAGAVDDAHPAATDDRFDPVPCEQDARGEHVCCISEPLGPHQGGYSADGWRGTIDP